MFKVINNRLKCRNYNLSGVFFRKSSEILYHLILCTGIVTLGIRPTIYHYRDSYYRSTLPNTTHTHGTTEIHIRSVNVGQVSMVRVNLAIYL